VLNWYFSCKIVEKEYSILKFIGEFYAFIPAEYDVRFTHHRRLFRWLIKRLEYDGNSTTAGGERWWTLYRNGGNGDQL
jgi:hypothetical protein